VNFLASLLATEFFFCFDLYLERVSFDLFEMVFSVSSSSAQLLILEAFNEDEYPVA